MKKLTILTSLLFLVVFSYSQNEFKDLKLALKKLNDLKGVSYDQTTASSAPFDTLNFRSKNEFVNVVFNSNDTIFYIAKSNDISTIEYLYDGLVSATLDWDERTVQIDSISNNNQRKNLPSPFIINAKNLMEYVIENQDSVQVRAQIFPDSITYSFSFNDKNIYFHNSTKIYHKKGVTSRYELTVDRKKNLPIAFKQKMPHQFILTNVSYKDLKYDVVPFKLTEILPTDFEKTERLDYQTIYSKAMQMKGKSAPNWALSEVDGETMSLEKIDTKVILLQFTTLGCGFCHLAVNFMKELTEYYENKNVRILSIEFSNSNEKMFQDYKKKNEINYPYLVGDKGLANQYGVIAGPTFLIINSEKEIVDIQVGYRKGHSEKIIKELIDSLL